MCRYFVEFNKCKFGSFCKFNHDAIGNRKFDQEIEMLRKELENVKNGIKEKEMEIGDKDEEIKKVGNVIEERMSSLEIVLKRMELDLQELKTENKYLKELLEGNEKSNGVNETLDELVGQDEIESESDGQPVEENQAEQVTSFKCTKCDFIGKNMAGLKIHDTAKHKEKEKPMMQRFSKVKK